MAIPVFPAGVNVGLSPNTAGSYSPDPTLYSQGLRAGLAEGTPLSQAVDGLNRGIEIDQTQRVNEANIAAQEERNQILARANTPEAIARAEREAIFKEEQSRKLLEIQTLQANTAAAKQALDAKREILESQKDALGIKKDTMAMGLAEKEQAQKNTILDSFNALDQDNPDAIAQGLAGLEANKNVLATNSITQKGKDVSVDPVYSANMQNIVERAKATGDPVLVQRADKLQKEYFQQISNAQNIAAGKPISLGADAPAKVLEDGTPEYNLGNGQTIREKAQPGFSSEADKLYEESQAIDSKTSIGTTPQQRDRELQINRQKLKAQGLSEEEINKQLGTSITENARVDENTYKSKRMDYLRKERLDQIAASGADPTSNESQKIASDYAKEMYAGNQFSQKQIDDLGQKTNAISGARVDIDKTRYAFERLQKLMKDTGIDPNLGKTQSLDQIKTNLITKADKDPAKIKLIDDIYSSINAAAANNMIKTVSEANLGVKIADSQKDAERLLSMQVGLDKSLAANIGVIQAADGIAYNREQQLEIMRFAATSNKPYSTAISLIDQYNDKSPATVEGTIDGDKFPLSNTGALRGRDFIAKYYFDESKATPSITNIPNPSNPAVPTTPDGRVAPGIAPGVSKQDAPGFGDELANVISMGQEAFKASIPPGDSVPDKHPDFNPTAALTIRHLDRESGGKRFVENDGAKGPFQFRDSTGKPLWKELGFEGAYNPYDPQKSLAMYQKYMGGLLKTFRGDTRSAVAAYFVGPGTIHRYRDKVDGDTEASWDQITMRMPDEVQIKGKDGRVLVTHTKKEIMKYVDDVMGDGGKAAGKSLAKQAFDLYKTGVVKTAKYGLKAMTAGMSDATDEEIASGIKSFGYGAADGFTFGATGELLELGSTGLGKSYDQSKAAEISGMADIGAYTVGAVIGAAYSPVMKILGAGARGLGILGSAESAPIVSEVVGNPSAWKAGVTAAKGAFIGGGITGIMEGDEAGGEWNLADRAISGLTTAGISAIVGGAIGTANQAIYNKMNPEDVTDNIAKAYVGTKTADELAEKAAAMDSPNKTILNTSTSREAEAAGRNAISGTRGAGNQVSDAAQKIESESSGKVSATIGNDGSTRTATGTKAAEGVKRSQEAIVQHRRETASRLITKAEASIEDTPLTKPGKPVNILDAEGNTVTLPGKPEPITIKTASGEEISSYKALKSPEIKELLQDPTIQREIAAVRAGDTAVGKQLPDDSFTVLDQVRRSLKEGTGHANADRAVLAKRLSTAMTDEVDGYRNYLRAYEKQSKYTDTATKGKAMKGLANMADEQKTRDVADFGKALFANDANALNKMTKFLTPESRQTTQQAAAAYLDDVFNTTGDIPRDILPKVDIIFGKGIGAKLEQELIANQAAKETAAGLYRVGNIDPITKELYSDAQKVTQGMPLVTRAGSVIRAATKTVADLVGNNRSITPKQVDEVIAVLSDAQAGKEFLATISKKFGEKNATALQGIFNDQTLSPQKKAQILGQLFGETELTSTE